MGLIPVANTADANRKIDAVFVHGLADDPRICWTHKGSGAFWPQNLGQELPEAGIWSFGFDARKFDPLGHAMPISDRAREALETLHVNDVGQRPVVFIAHSLGGILVKWMLRHAESYGNRDWRALGEKANGVVFFSTPHTGSMVASIFGKAPTVSVLVQELQADDAHLRDLNFWYRQYTQRTRIENRVYVEKHPTFGAIIVGEGSADPGLPDVVPVPLDGDHFEVCKIADPESTAYKGVVRFVRDRIQAVRSQPPSAAPSSGETAQQLREEHLLQDQALKARQLTAAYESLRLELDAARRIVLQEQVRSMEADLDTICQNLSRLRGVPPEDPQ